MKTTITGLALFLFITGIVQTKAQEINLDPVTVTSSLVERRASESGRSLVVVRGETLHHLPASSLDEILRYVPGVEIQARGPMGAQSDIVLRGGTFQQVLVILDGLRLNDPVTGHFNSYIPISPTEIDRIEILKGASSSLYGSEAVGGVISIITKTFAATAKEDAYLEGGVTVGSYGLLNGKAGGYLHRDRLRIAGGVLSNNARGEAQRGTTGYFHNHTASVSARYAIAPEWHIAYRGAFDKRDFSAQNFYTVFVSDTASEQVTGWWNQLEIGYSSSKTTLSLKAGYKAAADHYRYNTMAVANDNYSRLSQGLFTWQQQLSAGTSLVSGMNYQQKQIRSNDRGNHGLNQLAPFLLLNHQLGGFSLQPSLRIDWRERIGTEIVPQMTLSYKHHDWQFRASGGKTIRDADFTERFNNYNKELVASGSIGNPDLKAERSFSYEVGADWFPESYLKVSTTLFQRNHRDLIDYVSTPYDQMPRKDNLSPEGVYALARNIARITTRGVEIDGQYSQTLGGDHRLSAILGITLLDSDGAGQVPSFYIASHARLLTNFSLTWQKGRWNAAVNGLYKVREQREAANLETHISKQYAVINLQAAYALIPAHMSLFVQSDNLTNTRYSDLLGAQMPGRWLMCGLKFRL